MKQLCQSMVPITSGWAGPYKTCHQPADYHYTDSDSRRFIDRCENCMHRKSVVNGYQSATMYALRLQEQGWIRISNVPEEQAEER